MLFDWAIFLSPHAKGSSNVVLEVMAYTLLPLKRKSPKLEVIQWLAKKGDGFPLTVYLKINVKKEISDEPKVVKDFKKLVQCIDVRQTFNLLVKCKNTRSLCR